MKPLIIIRLLVLALSAAALATLGTGLVAVWLDLGALTQFLVTAVFVTLALLVEWRELEEEHEHEHAFDEIDAAPPPDGDTDDPSAAEVGTVKWFNRTKGFGFIIRTDGEEIFVHHRSIADRGRRHLDDGQQVEFVVVQTARGPQANRVRPLDPETET